MKVQNFQIIVSLDDEYLQQFSTLINNIQSLDSSYTTPAFVQNEPCLNIFTSKIEFFVCYDGKRDHLNDISTYFINNFPDFVFHFKHIPSECERLYEFLNDHYPYSESRNTLQSCSVYYRMVLDEIWPELEGWALNVDLDVVFKMHPKKMFYDTVNLDRQQTKFALYACPYPKIECWDLKPLVQDSLYGEWLNVEGRGILQIFVDKWIEEFAQLIQQYRPETNLTQFPCNFKTSAIHFNAGVLMFNITRYRQNEFNKVCRECIVLQKQFNCFRHNDQGILNFVFFNRLGSLTSNWNICDFGCNLPKLYNPTPQQINEFKQAYLIHFNGPYKPWDILARVPQNAKELWKQYEKPISKELLLKIIASNFEQKGKDCNSQHRINIKEWISQIHPNVKIKKANVQ
jgi:lipopolysaccharide biosynthesis glycosyltransferase